MKKSSLLCAAALLLLPVMALAASPFTGRWDLTITTAKATYPGWLQVVEKGGKTEVMVQPRTGHAHMAASKMAGEKLIVSVSDASDQRPATSWELTASGDRISGLQKTGKEEAKVVGVRAPELKKPMPKMWNAPEPIFNGKDLSGWEPLEHDAKNNWIAKDGTLLNQDGGANLKTTHTFSDFKLHVEFKCPPEGNSGVYLRGRYEVQVACGERGDNTTPVQSQGAIYGYLAPEVNVAEKPGEWQIYDVTLVGRMVTVVHNGTTIINNKEIPGITGGALDSKEGEPGPFYIQGDHTGGIQYRNITVATPKG